MTNGGMTKHGLHKDVRVLMKQEFFPDILKKTIKNKSPMHILHFLFYPHLFKRPPILIDAGSRMGQFAIPFLKIFEGSHAICIEPEHKINNLFREYMNQSCITCDKTGNFDIVIKKEFGQSWNEINELYLQQIRKNTADDYEIIEKILWHENTTKPMYMWDSGKNSIFSTLPCDKPPRDIGKYRYLMAVETVTLTELTDKYGWVDIMKMNVEGSEFEILENTDADTLGHIGQITFEAHYGYKSGYSEEGIIKNLENKSFKVSATSTDDEWQTKRYLAVNRRLRV